MKILCFQCLEMDNIIKVLYVVNFKFFEPVQKMNLQNK